jgi:MSHA pilin protein MshA
MFFSAPFNAQGFSLIELIAVILVIGLLSAMALPKFVNMQTEARVAAVQAAAGAVQSASDSVHAACLALDGCAAPSNGRSVTIAGVTGVFWYNGYATPMSRLPHAVGITDFVNVTGFTVTVPNVLAAYFTRSDAPDPTNCRVEFIGGGPVNNVPRVVAKTTGC